MVTFELTTPIEVLKLAPNSCQVFKNEEVDDTIKSGFTCVMCNKKNDLHITPYETGYSFKKLYEERTLSAEEILKHKIATRTSSWATYLGELTVDDLPTLYVGIRCKKCHSNYLAVFGYGEKQPGLTVLDISGVWHYRTLSNKPLASRPRKS